MSKSARIRVTFKIKRIAEDDWQFEANYPGAEIRYIKGFKSKVEADEWLGGTEPSTHGPLRHSRPVGDLVARGE